MNIVLEYTGYHKRRAGKFMNQIAETLLFEMYIKIKRMPKIKYGYVQLKVAPTTTTTTTLVLIGLSYNYNKSNRL
jgi:hypothetical protein